MNYYKTTFIALIYLILFLFLAACGGGGGGSGVGGPPIVPSVPPVVPSQPPIPTYKKVNTTKLKSSAKKINLIKEFEIDKIIQDFEMTLRKLDDNQKEIFSRNMNDLADAINDYKIKKNIKILSNSEISDIDVFQVISELSVEETSFSDIEVKYIKDINLKKISNELVSLLILSSGKVYNNFINKTLKENIIRKCPTFHHILIHQKKSSDSHKFQLRNSDQLNLLAARPLVFNNIYCIDDSEIYSLNLIFSGIVKISKSEESGCKPCGRTYNQQVLKDLFNNIYYAMNTSTYFEYGDGTVRSRSVVVEYINDENALEHNSNYLLTIQYLVAKLINIDKLYIYCSNDDCINRSKETIGYLDSTLIPSFFPQEGSQRKIGDIIGLLKLYVKDKEDWMLAKNEN